MVTYLLQTKTIIEFKKLILAILLLFCRQNIYSVNIKSINDIIDEEDETVIVNPGTVVNATISNSDSITFTITDDDDPPSIEYNVSSDFIEENFQMMLR